MTRTILATLVIVTGMAYPFVVYFGFERLSPRWLAVALGLLWLLRGVVSGGGQRWIQAVVVLLFCGLLFAANEPQLLHWYPVLVSLMLLAVFAGSLFHGMPVVERLARLREAELPGHAVAYTRRVTEAWVLFFAANAAVAAVLTLWAPRSWWLLYNGLIAYMLTGLMFAVEWLIRQRVRKAHELD